MPASRRFRVLIPVVATLVALTGCGSAPPDAATLLKQSSQHMLALKGFHFEMSITGFTTASVPVQSARGDARPPDLRASANLKEGGFLIEVHVIFAAGGVYLNITGGWQRLTDKEIAQFFDARALFDPNTGLFAAMRDTSSPSRGSSTTVNGHDTYPVSGQLAATRVHQLLAPIRDQGRYTATYWIESATSDLWRARLTGNLFDPSQAATITLDFSNHDHAVSVTPPPLG